jgi:hypothetical protein
MRKSLVACMPRKATGAVVLAVALMMTSATEIPEGGISVVGKSSMYQTVYRYAGYVRVHGMEVPVAGSQSGYSARDALARALREERHFALLVETYIRAQQRSARMDDLVYRYREQRRQQAYRIAY